MSVMPWRLVCFADKAFYRSQRRLIASARRFGALAIDRWDPARLKATPFYQENLEILSLRRGHGYWLWKPYIISMALADLPDDDFLMYADSGAEIVADPSPLFQLSAANDGIVLFENHGFTNKVWTKKDCFKLMSCDSEEYHESPQVNAAYLILRKTARASKLVADWVNFARDARILTDRPNELGESNHEDFCEHRHDQSILALLAKREGLHLFRDPSALGNAFKMRHLRRPAEQLTRDYSGHPMTCSDYGTIFDLHKRKHVPLGRRIQVRVGREIQELRRRFGHAEAAT
jgi:hypothetical protein